MEIGGYDERIEHNFSLEKCKEIVENSIRGYWPEMVVEQDEDPTCMFWYYNQEAKDAWDNMNARKIYLMIHTIMQEGLLTVVHDGDEDIVNDIRWGMMGD